MLLGDEQRAGEVVRLDPLPQELRVRRRLDVPEDAAGQRLQHRGARVALRREPAREIEPAVLQVGDAAGGLRQIGHVVQGEPQMGGDIGCRALSERTAGVVDGVQDAAGVPLEFGEVVVLPAHQVAQLDVGAAGLLGRSRPLVAQPLDLALQRQHRLERLGRHALADAEGRDAERLERLPLHRALEGDLERGALVERLGLEQRVEAGTERARDRLQEGELRFALSVLDHRQLARRAIDRGGELLERHARSACAAAGCGGRW